MRSLAQKHWPAADREAWARACRPAARLSRGGLAGHMKPDTQADLAQRYGCFLGHLARMGLLDLAAIAGTQVTPAAVHGFITEAKACWRSVTLAQSVYKLRRMAEILALEQDFTWLAEIEKDLALEACPKPRFDRIVTSEQIVEAGLALVQEAASARRQHPRSRAAQMRNGLMIALLALCPIRLKNLSALTLQESFVRQGERWWIVLSRHETKSGRPDERPVPEMLNRAIAQYLTWARPRLLRFGEFTIGADVTRAQLSGPLWVGTTGEALTYGAVERVIGDATHMSLGTRLSPHDFRSCAGVSVAFWAGDRLNLGSALLQHTDRRVTDEHYNRTSTLQASLAYSSIIAGLRERVEPSS